MVRIDRGIEVIQVAGNAGCALQGVVSVDVALRALQRIVSSGQWKARRGMIESGARPGNCAMARVTGRGESCLHMVWVGGALVILHVAGRAHPAGQTVIPVHMTLRTLHGGMESCQREAGGGVVEAAVTPGSGVVALQARSRKSGLNVGRIIRALKIAQVTTYARVVCQCVIVVDVAL